MTFHFENESSDSFSFDCKELGAKLFEFVMDYVECPYEAEVSMLLTTDAEIHAINKEQRNIDNATDVLSFPMNEFEQPGDFMWLEEAEDSFEPDTGELLLGDIVISTEHIKTQAEEFDHSEKREFAFLTVHSLLHLIGYDHMTEKDAKEMEDLQRNILDKFGISR